MASEVRLARDTVRRYLAMPLPEREQQRHSTPLLERFGRRLERLMEEWSNWSTSVSSQSAGCRALVTGPLSKCGGLATAASF